MSEAQQEWQVDLDSIRAMVAGRANGSVLPARFYVEAQENPAKSAAAGRPVFDDVEMIEIIIDRTDTRQRPVTKADIEAYPALYLAFKQGESQEKAEGTPLREWPPIKRSQAESLAAAGIRTVEHLAGASDGKLQQIGPLMALRTKARDWLEEAQKGAGMSALRAENESLKNRLQAVERMLATQSTEIEAARNNGGSLPAGPDPRIEAMQAKMDAIIAGLAAKTPEPAVAVQVEDPPKRRGRPKGSKNKPKDPPQEG